MTPDQFKTKLKRQGKTIGQWAEENGFPSSAVYRAINGVDKGDHGRAHDILVRAGIKPAEPSQAVSEHSSTPTSANGVAGSADRFHLGAVLTDRALPVAVPVTGEDNLLSGLEARLADGMRDFSSALLEFARVSQAVHKELPLTSEFGKHITLLFSTFSLQLAYALLKDGDVPLLLDDGAQHLHKLGLRVDEFFRELDVDGRRFLAIALIEQHSAHVFKDNKAATDSANP